MRARDGDDVLKGLEGGLKDSNKREQRSGAEHCLFICFHQAMEPKSRAGSVSA